MQVVVFTLKDEEYAVETAKVLSINDMMEITKIPKAPSYIKGLINLRGNIISLLDLNLLLNIDNPVEQKNIIIVKVEEEEVGITVDLVNEVLEIDEKIIEKVEADKKKQYIKGVINFKTKVVTLIDIDKLLPNY
ncbi:chemotaxis protein CheW [Clostridium cellulovorans]|uniref:CheW protein n=1 Tax=Clostridium cellulovorans (strain ATCC 35296 / DSM 3052 / OCM 3 / 743B) TaxID=573061 RepID=D9SKE4_CLOC7|nr:chemotaxis protein CheW [Clostridium cellulovorans]ADL51440.1 CheW protein [Clostridium cellulovorans 743B]